MAQDKDQQSQQDHIPTETQDDSQEEQGGSKGLLSAIGDPVGMSLFRLSFSVFCCLFSYFPSSLYPLAYVPRSISCLLPIYLIHIR